MSMWGDLAPARIAFGGDWHGNGPFAADAIEYAAVQGAQVLLHVGDFAFTFHPGFLDWVQDCLDETGLVLGFVAGNHDDYTYLDAREWRHGLAPIPLRPDLFYLPRNYRWTWDGVRFLALGGAHSVDRPWRRPGVEWWEREQITDAEAQQAIDCGHADVMVCHDVPAGVYIPCIQGNPHGFPVEELEAAERHRFRLRTVVDAVQPQHLFAGHYHCRLDTSLVDTRRWRYRTSIHILDADSAPVEQNVTVLELAELKASPWPPT